MAEQRVTLTPQMSASTISTTGRRPDGFRIRPATVPTDDPVEDTACTSRTGQRRAPGSTTHHAAVDTRPHILVVHRRRDEHAPYENYIDHTTHRVTYVTTELGWSSLPSAAAGVVEVTATDDFRQVSAAAATLTALFGAPDRVVALTESDLDTAAPGRARPGLPGRSPRDLARLRDKLVMCETISAAGARSAPTEGAGFRGR
ncbi:hypothetical protein OG987_14845 [Streptomyces sp. NBC_01620]|uniref:hypothetical protein n=1 Tax=Streptomyces sp. NBC_01620 TaxID=2975902 RepID=UPI003867E605|nr:hypothetical protein OG987_14845 [Streptomyces sp. NBC_01620]